MLKEFRCDLHIHTCLSPCADLDMYPSAIVAKSLEERLDVIAVCDHNSSENVLHVINAAQGKPLKVLPGMEISSREEVHLVALFDKLDALLKLQSWIYDHLPGKNEESVFGCQAIVNELDEVEGFNERLLIGATELSIDEIVANVHELGGLAIASHIDRQGFGIISHLGFIPPDLRLDALEISVRMGLKEARKEFAELYRMAFIEASDAHFIRDIGRGSTRFLLEDATVEELKMAFRKQRGRLVLE
jgi:predicted metal-dependent phosphoesterase TrpH